MQHVFELSLEEIYTGVTKHVEVTRKVRCKACKGKGGKKGKSKGNKGKNANANSDGPGKDDGSEEQTTILVCAPSNIAVDHL